MVRIIDERGSDKTTKLIELALKDNAILVVPTYRHMSNVKTLIKQMYPNSKERPNVGIITFHDFLIYKDTEKYYIDELDACLRSVGVLGYSNSIEEENQNGSKEV